MTNSVFSAHEEQAVRPPIGAVGPGTTPHPLKPSRWWLDEVFYEVFARSFQDSNDDGIGDLDGVTSRLDYLRAKDHRGGSGIDTLSLGVTGVWLTPVFPSPSDHGYDVTDFKAIHPQLGTMESFDRLVAEAHARGIKVILDLPVNHTSSRHPWFLEACRDPSSPRRQFYLWRQDPPAWTFADKPEGAWHPCGAEHYFATFGSDLPDLNWENPAVYDEILDVFLFWMARGIDGFRLDAARFLIKGPAGERDVPGTHRIWQRLVADVKERHPDTLFVGEVWTDAAGIGSYHGEGRELDGAFAFPISGGILEAVANGRARSLARTLAEAQRHWRPIDFAFPFVTNHDMPRAASLLAAVPGGVELAALIYLTLPGTPFIYYGEEIGLLQGEGPGHIHDRGERTPMPWRPGGQRGFTGDGQTPWLAFSKGQASVSGLRGDEDSLWHRYRRLVGLRLGHVALTRGDLSDVRVHAPGVLSYVRRWSDGPRTQAVLVVLNLRPGTVDRIALPVRHPFGRRLFGEGAFTLRTRDSSPGGTWRLDVSGLRGRSGLVVSWDEGETGRA